MTDPSCRASSSGARDVLNHEATFSATDLPPAAGPRGGAEILELGGGPPGAAIADCSALCL